MGKVRSKHVWTYFSSVLDGRPKRYNEVAQLWEVNHSVFLIDAAKESFDVLEQAGLLRRVGDYYVADLTNYPEGLKRLGLYKELDENSKLVLEEWDKWLMILNTDVVKPLLRPEVLRDVFRLDKMTVREIGWKLPLEVAGLVALLSLGCDESMPEEVREFYEALLSEPMLSSALAWITRKPVSEIPNFYKIPEEVKERICEVFPLVKETKLYRDVVVRSAEETLKRLMSRMEYILRKYKGVA